MHNLWIYLLAFVASVAIYNWGYVCGKVTVYERILTQNQKGGDEDGEDSDHD